MHRETRPKGTQENQNLREVLFMKTKAEIYQMVVTILAEEFEMDKDSITMEVNLYQELGLDSIDAVDLIIRLQELCGKQINPDTFKRVRTVEHVVNAIDDIVNRQ
jgi:acyl carrier protein